MEANPLPALIGWGLLTAASIGGTVWGVQAIRQQQERTEERVAAAREAQQQAQMHQQAQTALLLQQINPVMIVGTVVMTGLGAFIMARGLKRQRRERRTETMERY